MARLLRLAVILMSALLVSCSSQEIKAKEQASWDATARMTVRAWVEGSVSDRFAADTLEAGNRATHSSRYQSARQAVINKNRSAAVDALGR